MHTLYLVIGWALLIGGLVFPTSLLGYAAYLAFRKQGG